MEEYKYVVYKPPNCDFISRNNDGTVVTAGFWKGKADILSKHFLSGSGRIIDGGGGGEGGGEAKKIKAKEK